MAGSILDATEALLQRAQAKITYLGDQDKPIGSVIFSSAGHSVSMRPFLAVQPSPTAYTNDQSPYSTHFSVTPVEFRRMLQAVKPALDRSGTSPRAPVLSFTVVRETGQTVDGQEFLLGYESGERFYRSLIDALDPVNGPGRAALIRQFRSIYPE